MSEDTILCHQCGKDLVMKFIELKDLVFCSSTCFENFKNAMSRKDFFKNYGDAFKPDEQKWVQNIQTTTSRCAVIAHLNFLRLAGLNWI